MRSKLVVTTIALVTVVACGDSNSPYGGGGGGCTPTATQVCMAGTTFNPTTLTVSAGTQVTWKNGSTAIHTVNSATGSPTTYSSGDVTTNGTFSHTFSAAGTYPYYCLHHGADGTPPTGMHGTITVTP